MSSASASFASSRSSITAQGQPQPVSVGNVVRAYPANQLTFADQLGIYLSRWWEFLSDEPREANSDWLSAIACSVRVGPRSSAPSSSR